jgi:hypothetical protein
VPEGKEYQFVCEKLTSHITGGTRQQEVPANKTQPPNQNIHNSQTKIFTTTTSYRKNNTS